MLSSTYYIGGHIRLDIGHIGWYFGPYRVICLKMIFTKWYVMSISVEPKKWYIGLYIGHIGPDLKACHYYHITLLLNTLLQILSFQVWLNWTQLLILENILWLTVCRINKFGLNTLPSKTVAIPYTCGLSCCFWN